MASAYQKPLLPLSAKADAAQTSSAQFRAVKFASDGDVKLCDTAGEKAIGILQTAVASGSEATYETQGVSKAVLGGTVTLGDKLATDANGDLVLAEYGEAVVAIALASGVDNDIIPALMALGASMPVAVYSFPVTLSLADNATVARWTPGFAGKIKKVSCSVTTVTTDTTGKEAVLTPKIAGTSTTGGVLSVQTDTAANDPDTLGKAIDATAITGANTFSASQELTLVASNTTPFTDGAVNVIVTVEPI